MEMFDANLPFPLILIYITTIFSIQTKVKRKSENMRKKTTVINNKKEEKRNQIKHKIYQNREEGSKWV
jgi:hypothetical protein